MISVFFLVQGFKYLSHSSGEDRKGEKNTEYLKQKRIKKLPNGLISIRTEEIMMKEDAAAGVKGKIKTSIKEEKNR